MFLIRSVSVKMVCMELKSFLNDTEATEMCSYICALFCVTCKEYVNELEGTNV